MNGDYSRDFVEAYFRNCRGTTPIDQTLQLDAQIMMVDDPVKRVDNMAMAWGLETRVPFLDHEVVELAARIPAELKVRGGGKYILKEASRGLVPDEVIDRSKGYFPVPALQQWRAGLCQRCSEGGEWSGEYAPGCVDGHDAGRDSQHPTATGRKHHHRGVADSADSSAA